MKVKIFGAGSIGNHLANASRSLGWSVDLCDVDEAALARTQTQIYPSRYGGWDDAIRLFKNDEAPVERYDLICVGTPPESHIALARQAIEERPKAILVEKPFCTPGLNGAQELYDAAVAAGTEQPNDRMCWAPGNSCCTVWKTLGNRSSFVSEESWNRFSLRRLIRWIIAQFGV